MLIKVASEAETITEVCLNSRIQSQMEFQQQM